MNYLIFNAFKRRVKEVIDQTSSKIEIQKKVLQY